MLALLLNCLFVPQGNYAPVTADDVRAMKLDHYYLTDRSLQDGEDFSWTFTGDRFSIQAKKGPIPGELLSRLLPEKSTAKTISGNWTVSEGRIRFSNIAFDGGKPGRKKAEYNVYRTAPTVIRIGEPQYVFGLIR